MGLATIEGNRKWPVLIGFLGNHGSGKTTQIRLLRNFLITQGAQVETPPIAARSRETLHRIAWSQGKTNAYDIFDSETITICGALEVLNMIQSLTWSPQSRRFLIVDKYTETFRAIGLAHGLKQTKRTDLVLGLFPPLDVRFYFRIDPQEAGRRIRYREQMTLENEDPIYLDRYHREFDDGLLHDGSTKVVDASLPIDRVHKIVVSYLLELGYVTGNPISSM